VGSEIVFQSI